MGKIFLILTLILTLTLTGCSDNKSTSAPDIETSSPEKVEEVDLTELTTWLTQNAILANKQKQPVLFIQQNTQIPLKLQYQQQLKYDGSNWECSLPDGIYFLQGRDLNGRRAISLLGKFKDDAFISESDVLNGQSLELVCQDELLKLNPDDPNVSRALSQIQSQLQKL